MDIIVFEVVDLQDGLLSTRRGVRHGLSDCDGPFLVVSSGTLPSGLTEGAHPWVILHGPRTFSLATSPENAASRVAIPLTAPGHGVHAIVRAPLVPKSEAGSFVVSLKGDFTGVSNEDAVRILDAIRRATGLVAVHAVW